MAPGFPLAERVDDPRRTASAADGAAPVRPGPLPDFPTAAGPPAWVASWEAHFAHRAAADVIREGRRRRERVG